MAELYEVEVEPEVGVWLDSLPDRDFGRVDFMVGVLAERAETLGEPARAGEICSLAVRDAVLEGNEPYVRVLGRAASPATAR